MHVCMRVRWLEGRPGLTHVWVVTSPVPLAGTGTWSWTPACTDNNPAFYKVQNMIIIVCDVECYQLCYTGHAT